MRVGRVLILMAAGAATAACHPRHLHRGEAINFDHRPMRAVTRLTCPETVGELRRTGQTPDGQSCSYAGPQAEDIKLMLASLNGMSADARLAAVDAGLKGEVPAAVGANHGPGVYISSDKGADQAHIDLPGFHLNASGGKASIHMPGVNIDADNDQAKVSTGFAGAHQAVIKAHDGGAEIRAGGVGASGADVTYLLASDSPGPSGYRAVGYVAKGPAAGPLVIGEFRIREHGQNNPGAHGLNRLVDMNVHG